MTPLDPAQIGIRTAPGGRAEETPSDPALIGITTNSGALPDWSEQGPSRALDYVFQDYTAAVETAAATTPITTKTPNQAGRFSVMMV